MIIYKITNIINKKVYIGKTIRSLIERWNKHVSDCKRLNWFLYRAIRKHGIDNFIIEEIDSADTLYDLNCLEIYWINFYQSRNDRFGYNVHPGGKGGDTYTKNPNREEVRKKITPNAKTKQKIRESLKKLWQDPIYADRMKKSHTGKKQSKEQIEKRRISCKRKATETDYYNSLDRTKKLSEAASKRWADPEFKNITLKKMREAAFKRKNKTPVTHEN